MRVVQISKSKRRKDMPDTPKNYKDNVEYEMSSMPVKMDHTYMPNHFKTISKSAAMKKFIE